MDGSEHRHADHSPPSGSDNEGGEGQFQPRVKLRVKLEKLAQWRMDPSLIKLSTDGPEFVGGHATVSAGFLARPPSNRNSTDRPEDTVDGEKEKVEDDNYPHIDDHDTERERQGPMPEGEEIPPGVKIVAVKKLKIPDDTSFEYTLGLALREAEFLVDLTHPNIIKLEGFAEDMSKNRIWLIFPWLENGSLKGFLASTSWELPEHISLIQDVLNGLEYIHCQAPPICHGDLKPQNIMIDSSYHAVISDFGSARRFTNRTPSRSTADYTVEPTSVEAADGRDNSSIQATFSAASSTITLTNNHFTLRWAAPELLMDGEVSPCTDIWALGWIIYEVLTGEVPFTGVNHRTGIIVRVIRGQVPSVAEDDRVSRVGALCTLMNQCWQPVPSERPTAEGCRDAISWMPSSVPSPRESSEFAAARDSYAYLQIKLGDLHALQDNGTEALKAYYEAWRIFTNTGNYNNSAVALRNIAMVHYAYKEYKQAIPCLTQAIQIFSKLSNDRAKASTLCDLASVYLANEGTQDVTSVYLKALQLYTTLDDARGRAKVLSDLANVYNRQKKYGEVITHYNEILEIYTTLDDSRGRAATLCSLGEVYEEQEQHDEAIQRYSEALRICTNIRSLQGKAKASNRLGRIYWSQGMGNEAIFHYSEALKANTSLGRNEIRAPSLRQLGGMYRLQGKYREATSQYVGALETYKILGDSEEQENTLYDLAAIYEDQGQNDKASPHYSNALKLYLSSGPSKRRGDALARLGETYYDQEKYDDAIFSYSEALNTYKDIGESPEIAEALYHLGEVYRDQEKHEDAFYHYSKALQIYETIGSSTGIADTLQSLGMIRYKQGYLVRAIPFLEQAATIFSQVVDRAEENVACLDEIVYIGRLIRGSYLNGSHLRFGDRYLRPAIAPEYCTHDPRCSRYACSYSAGYCCSILL